MSTNVFEAIENVDRVTSTPSTTISSTTISSANSTQTIINNQEGIAKRLLKIEKGMEEIFSQLQNLFSAVSTLTSSSHSMAKATGNENETIEFEKINDENDLIEFEKSIEDRKRRKVMMEYFVDIIGKFNNDASVRSIALKLDQKIFTESFWSKTAWTGGRNVDGPKKFPFVSHTTCTTFFNDVIRNACGSHMSSSEFAQFVMSRTRNSAYIRTTNRQSSARTARKRKLTIIAIDEQQSSVGPTSVGPTSTSTCTSSPKTVVSVENAPAGVTKT